MEISEINDRESLAAWLEDKPCEWTKAIAARAALRVAPVAFSVAALPEEELAEQDGRATILSTFRANFMASVARTHPTKDLRDAAAAAANAAAAAAYSANAAAAAVYSADAAVYSANAAAAAAYAANAAAAAVYSADAADAAGAYAAAAAADYLAIWGSVRRDARWLDAYSQGTPVSGVADGSTDAKALMGAQLWLDNADLEKMPDWAATNFNAFTQSELAQTTSFGLIAEWYRAALNGKSAFGKKADITIATMSSKEWGDEDETRDCLAAMDRVAEKAGWRRSERLEEISNQDEREAIEISIPPMQPAALEPEWQDGQLVIPKRKVSNDYAGGDFNAALTALRNLLADFENELAKVANVDNRFLKYFRELVAQAPTELPAQDRFFMFAHNELVLEVYIKTAQQEWDGVTAARFAAIVMQFSQTVEKVPAWRAFKKSTPTGELSAEDLSNAEELATSLTVALEEEDAQEFIDPEIPKRLQELVDKTPEVIAPESGDRLVTPDTESRIFDFLESVNNTLKRIFGAALWAKGKLSEFGSDTYASFSMGAREENRKQAEQLGQTIVQWAYRAIKVGPVGGLVWLSTKFGWLVPVIEFFKKAFV